MTTIEEIATVASAAARNAAELRESIDAERTAEAAVLAAALAVAKPALRAVCSRLVSLDLTTGQADVNRHREHREYHDRRGLHLDGSHDAEQDQPRDNDGGYEGRGLFVLQDGELAVAEWTGVWSRWQGSSDRCEMALTPVTVREAMDEWNLERCLKNLHEALKASAEGKAPERSKAARERAARLMAMTTLAK